VDDEMARPQEVRCSKKQTLENGTSVVTHIGGPNSDGTSWCMPMGLAVEDVDFLVHAFFILNAAGTRVPLVVILDAENRKYLEVEQGPVSSFSLFDLPDCS
jgi:hypothetical protein